MTRSNLKQTSWESINLRGDNLDNNVAALNKVLKGFIAYQEKKAQTYLCLLSSLFPVCNCGLCTSEIAQ